MENGLERKTDNENKTIFQMAAVNLVAFYIFRHLTGPEMSVVVKLPAMVRSHVNIPEFKGVDQFGQEVKKTG